MRSFYVHLVIELIELWLLFLPFKSFMPLMLFISLMFFVRLNTKLMPINSEEYNKKTVKLWMFDVHFFEYSWKQLSYFRFAESMLWNRKCEQIFERILNLNVNWSICDIFGIVYTFHRLLIETVRSSNLERPFAVLEHLSLES